MKVQYILIGFWFVMLVATFRLHVIHKIRMSFLVSWELYESVFENLPSFEAMIFRPKYWSLWTRKQWLHWVEK